MSGDYSRHSFDPRRHFSSVLMQQGRVALDADWNELCAIAERRMRAETVDIIGRAVVPKETPAGFQISVSGSDADKTLTIGRGRIYVHGLLAENHGEAPFVFDLAELDANGRPLGVLAELVGGATIDYEEQPFLPNPPALPESNGPHLVYLDVWQREVTYVEDERLLEKALGGVDTTTRLQTVWQVRVLEDVGEGTTCATPDAEIPGWLDKTRPSAGRLSSEAVTVEDPTDPCLIPPSGGYKGLENQLYRVEIHDGGGIGTATFKWSRDNATIATNIVALPANDVLTVVRVMRDSVLRFNPGDWVEITDDGRELAGLPGEMRKVKSVDDGARRITLTAALPADLIPSGVDADTLFLRRTRVRRWDHRGAVRDVDGNLLVDLDDPAAVGTIPVPAPGTSVMLENGVLVTFDLAEDGGSYHVGDLWNFAARTADASVEELNSAPPRGIHHHFCRLAVASFPDSATDCRVLWPPEFGGGEGCGCSVCVTPESHNGGTLTIQQAIDQVRATGGTVCLDAGQYNLGATPVQLDGAQSVRLLGQGWRTMLSFAGNGPAVIAQRTIGVSIEDLTVLVPPEVILGSGTVGGGPGFLLRNALGVSVSRCVVLQYASPNNGGGPAIALGGYVLGARLTENILFAPTGIGNAPADPDQDFAPLLTANLVVLDNLLACQRRGVSLQRMSLHMLDNRIGGNTVYGCSDGGIIAAGGVGNGGRLDILGNLHFAAGDGIRFGTSATRVEGNDVTPLANAETGDGIVIAEGLDKQGPRDCLIIGNRVTNMPGRGISLRRALRSAMIKQNIVRGARLGGIVMDGESRADALTIDNNQLFDIAAAMNADQPIAAIRALRVGQLQLVGNSIAGVAAVAVQNPVKAGIEVLGCDAVNVSGNEVDRVAPARFIGTAAAIRLLVPFGSAQIGGNTVQRGPEDTQGSPSEWYALRIGAPQAAPAASGAAPAVQTPIFLLSDTLIYVIDQFRVRAAVPPARMHLGVQGNVFASWSGGAPIVRIETGDTCIFSGNHCSVTPDTAANQAVTIAARTVAAANNVVRRGTERDAMDIDARVFTVVGNITFGNIRIRTLALPAPWDVLNLVSP